MIYLDTSALLKLVWEEPESAAIARWLEDRAADVPPVTSDLGRIELLRGCRRKNPAALASGQSLLTGIDLIPIADGVVDLATQIGDPTLRSLDAIHLASAVGLQAELTAFVSYDRRLLDAAANAGLNAVAPGVENS